MTTRYWKVPLAPALFDKMEQRLLDVILNNAITNLVKHIRDAGHDPDLPTMHWEVHDPRTNPFATQGDWPFLFVTMEEVPDDAGSEGK